MAQPPALPSTYSSFGGTGGGSEGDLVITFKPERSPALRDLAESFAGLDRFYSRAGEHGAELVLKKIESGSIIATVAAMSPILNDLMPVISGMNNTVTFGKRLTKAIKAFAELDGPSAVPAEASFEDARDVEQILRTVAKNGGGRLALRSITYASADDSSRYLNVEFNDNEVAQAYRASSAIAPLAVDMVLPSPLSSVTQRLITEEAMVLDQTTRKPAKESGRTGDKGIISTVTEKPLPVYFKKTAQSLKERMILSDDNPLRFIFIVDAYVHYVDQLPTAYTVINLHSVIPLDE